MLEAAVVAGPDLAPAPTCCGSACCPTPAVAYLTGAYGADLGVVLSARHNPMPDNGIKLFAAAGTSCPTTSRPRSRPRSTPAAGAAADGRRDRPGSATADDAADALPRAPARRGRPTPLDGLHVVVDCAHGAASAVAPEVYRARRRPRSSRSPPSRTGCNINDGVGSTHLDGLAAAAVARTAPTSASRTTATPTAAWPSTPTGAVVDGDQILAICALALREAGRAARRHRRRHRDEQPRLPPRDARRRHRGADHRGRRPLRARGAAANGPQPRRRAERPRRLHRRRHHRRRPAHRAAADGPHGHAPAARWPSSPPWSSGCRRCWSTCGSPTATPWPPRPRSPARSRGRRRELGDDGRVLLRPSAPSSWSG